MSNANIVPFAQPAAPAVTFGDMTRLAEAVARSGLFGIKTPDQALALMALAQAEGRHPATVARDYHIISGSPSKKAEAMQRDFLMAGGRIEWLELTDDAVEATFSHPLGGTATIRWDNERCRKAGLTGGNHAKFPRQMKRSRVVSEGVRTVWPLATSGMYVPEEIAEVAEFAAPQPVADTRADLDAFAAEKPATVIDAAAIDAETGEIIDPADIEAEARRIAAQGWAALKRYADSLSDAGYEILRPLLGTRMQAGELRLIAQAADAQPHSPAGTNGNGADQSHDDRKDAALGGAKEPAGDADLLGDAPEPDYHVKLTGETAEGWQGWRLAMEATIEHAAKLGHLDKVRRQNRDNLAILEQVDAMAHNRLIRALEGVR